NYAALRMSSMDVASTPYARRGDGYQWSQECAGSAGTSRFQGALGPRGYARQSRARLLLSGSAISVMGQLLGGSAPLRGRASLELIIRPFGYCDAAKVMNPGHLERLRRARDLLAVKGYDTEQTRLTCYSGAHFDSELADRAAGEPSIQLIGL